MFLRESEILYSYSLLLLVDVEGWEVSQMMLGFVMLAPSMLSGFKLVLEFMGTRMGLGFEMVLGCEVVLGSEWELGSEVCMGSKVILFVSVMVLCCEMVVGFELIL